MAKGKTVVMVSDHPFRIHLGAESKVSPGVKTDYPYFQVVKGDNDVPEELVDHWAVKAHGLKRKE